MGVYCSKKATSKPLKTKVEGPRRRRWKQEYYLLIFEDKRIKDLFVCLGENLGGKREESSKKRLQIAQKSFFFFLKVWELGGFYIFLVTIQLLVCT